MRGMLHHLGFMPLEPTPLGVNTLLIRHTTSDAKKFLEINVSSQFFDFSNSTCIILLNTGTEGVARFV